jgi:hypothetical protein
MPLKIPCLQALPHHRVQQWLAAEGNHLLPARTYRARALAEVARSVTFERRGRGGARRRASLDACALGEEEQEDAERPASRGPGGFGAPSVPQGVLTKF